MGTTLLKWPLDRTLTKYGAGDLVEQIITQPSPPTGWPGTKCLNYYLTSGGGTTTYIASCNKTGYTAITTGRIQALFQKTTATNVNIDYFLRLTSGATPSYYAVRWEFGNNRIGLFRINRGAGESSEVQVGSYYSTTIAAATWYHFRADIETINGDPNISVFKDTDIYSEMTTKPVWGTALQTWIDTHANKITTAGDMGIGETLIGAINVHAYFDEVYIKKES